MVACHLECGWIEVFTYPGVSCVDVVQKVDVLHFRSCYVLHRAKGDLLSDLLLLSNSSSDRSLSQQPSGTNVTVIYHIEYIDPAYIATIYHNIYWYTCKDVFSILLLGAVIIIAINSPKICYNITIISTLAHITANQLGNAESKGTLNYDKAHIILQRSRRKCQFQYIIIPYILSFRIKQFLLYM